MKYVLDSNVAVKWALPEADTPQAVRFLNQVRQGIHEILAPDIYPVEVAHALSRAERRGIIRPPLGARRLRSRPAMPSRPPFLPAVAPSGLRHLLSGPSRGL